MKKALFLLLIITIATIHTSCTSSEVSVPSASSGQLASASPTPFALSPKQYYIVWKGDRQGVVDEQGNVILPAEFQNISVLSYENSPVVFLTKDGTVHLKGTALKSNGGLYCADGKPIGEVSYTGAYPLNEKLLAVCNNNDKSGVIEFDGSTKIPCKYDCIFPCAGKIVAVDYGERKSYHYDDYEKSFDSYAKPVADIYDSNGALLCSGEINITMDYYYNGYNLFYDYYNYRNYYGYDFFDFDYLTITDDTGTKYGLADTRLNTVLPPVWHGLSLAGNDRFIVREDKKSGVIDAEGDEIIPLRYDYIDYRYDTARESQYFSASLNNEAYIFDRNGNQLFYSSQYTSAEIQNGVIITTDSTGNWHALDSDGDELVPPASYIYWDSVGEVFIRSYYTSGNDYKQEYYTKDGKLISFSGYSIAGAVSYDIFLVSMPFNEERSLYGLCDRSGKTIVPALYYGIRKLNNSSDLFIFSTEAIPLQTKNSVMDLSGNIIIPPEFDYIYQLEGNLLYARQGPLSGLIDINGNWVWYASDYDTLMD